MMMVPLGPSGWGLDLGKWAWGMFAGAISGAAGTVILTPVIAQLDPEHFNSVFEPGPHTIKLMLVLFGYGMLKNMLTYMATNQIPSPFRDTRTSTIEASSVGGLKIAETTTRVQEYRTEALPLPVMKKEKK